MAGHLRNPRRTADALIHMSSALEAVCVGRAVAWKVTMAAQAKAKVGFGRHRDILARKDGVNSRGQEHFHTD